MLPWKKMAQPNGANRGLLHSYRSVTIRRHLLNVIDEAAIRQTATCTTQTVEAGMTIPMEFTPEAIEAVSGPDAFTPYDQFLSCRQPVDSIVESNPWMRTPMTQEEVVWGEGRFYDTTVGRKHEYWKDFDLPTPTEDLRQLRQDLFEWGFCLLEDGLSKSFQYSCLRPTVVS